MGRQSQPETTPIVNVTPVHSYGGANVVAIHNTQDDEEELIPLVNVVVDDPDAPGDPASPEWRDLPFALLFWAHLAVMIWLGVAIAPKGFELVHLNLEEIEEEMRKNDDVTEETIGQFDKFVSDVAAYLEIYPARIALCLVVPCCVLAFVFGLLGTSTILKPCPRTIIYSCLVSTILWTVIILLSSAIATGGAFLYIMTGVSLLAVAYYVRLAWRMVPFAAVNLKVALEGIGQNCGIFIVAFLFAEIGFFWVIYWFYVLVGTFSYQNNKCQAEHPDQNFDMDSDDYSHVCDPPAPVFIFFLLSLYWTGTIVMVCPLDYAMKTNLY